MVIMNLDSSEDKGSSGTGSNALAFSLDEGMKEGTGLSNGDLTRL